MEDKELLFKVDANGRRLSKGQRAISQYVFDHADKAAFMTASRLGEQVGVSESTVVRYAIALGYDGYPALQKALQEALRNRLTTMQRVEMVEEMPKGDVLNVVLKSDIHNIRQTLENIDREAFDAVINSLYAARKVYVLGVRSSAPLAQFLGYYLNFLLENVQVVTPGISEVQEQIVRIGEADLLLGVSFPRYSARAVEAMRYARGRGACVVALTDRAQSPVGKVADHCLIARSDMASFVDSLVAPLSVINALMVAMSLRGKEGLREYFDSLEGLWRTNNVYSQEGL